MSLRVCLSLLFVITAPFAWFVMDHWLDGFAYRIAIGAGTFDLGHPDKPCHNVAYGGIYVFEDGADEPGKEV